MLLKFYSSNKKPPPLEYIKVYLRALEYVIYALAFWRILEYVIYALVFCLLGYIPPLYILECIIMRSALCSPGLWIGLGGSETLVKQAK